MYKRSEKYYGVKGTVLVESVGNEEVPNCRGGNHSNNMQKMITDIICWVC